MSDNDLIALPHLARELVSAGYGPTPVPYSRLYKMILNAMYPAEQISGRWHIRRADLPVVALALGLKAVTSV